MLHQLRGTRATKAQHKAFLNVPFQYERLEKIIDILEMPHQRVTPAHLALDGIIETEHTVAAFINNPDMMIKAVGLINRISPRTGCRRRNQHESQEEESNRKNYTTHINHLPNYL